MYESAIPLCLFLVQISHLTSVAVTRWIIQALRQMVLKLILCSLPAAPYNIYLQNINCSSTRSHIKRSSLFMCVEGWPESLLIIRLSARLPLWDFTQAPAQFQQMARWPRPLVYPPKICAISTLISCP